MLTTRGLAEALVDDDQFELALKLTAVSETISARYGYLPTTDERRRIDHVVARCATVMGDEAFDGEMARGSSFDLDSVGELLHL